MEDQEETHLAMHSYARRTLSTDMETVAGQSDGFMPLPDTPEPNPAKKSKPSSDSPAVSDTMLMRFMQRMEAMHEETLRRIQGVEKTVIENSNSIKQIINSLEFHGEQVKCLNEKSDEMQKKIGKLEKENVELRDRCNDLDAYKRRWNLRVAGIPENSGENVKRIIIDLFSQVSPSIAADLHFGIDIAHRLGPRSAAEKSSRRIIVLFSSRSQRDTVWKDAKTSNLLREKKIKVFEDLSQKDKDARTLLWPTVERARREGKRAGFHGPFAVIEGKRLSAKDLANKST